MDIVVTIDAATGCQQCTGPRGDSPSDDFCSEGCQATWRAHRVGVVPGFDSVDAPEWRIRSLYAGHYAGPSGGGVSRTVRVDLSRTVRVDLSAAIRALYPPYEARRFWLPTARPRSTD